MYNKKVLVEECLEARSAALFVQTASNYRCHVRVNIGDKTVNGKSIMGMISLGILDGQTITIMADGEDEKQAADDLAHFFLK